QTETEATGAPQKHHYTLNQQVGSITGFCAIQGRFISARMITQLAAYGSFINDQSVAYNKSASEHVFQIIRQFEKIYFSNWQTEFK
ncbi:hypothetical protein, partial [Klebsiella pneumoniae]